MYSALQVGGRRLYDIARAGEQVERTSRRIEVSEMRLLAWRPPDAEFVVRVGSGTYVRTLCPRPGGALRQRGASGRALADRDRPVPARGRGDHRGPGLAGARGGAATRAPRRRAGASAGGAARRARGPGRARWPGAGRAPCRLPAGLDAGGDGQAGGRLGSPAGCGPASRAERASGIPEGFQGAVAPSSVHRPLGTDASHRFRFQSLAGHFTSAQSAWARRSRTEDRCESPVHPRGIVSEFITSI